MTHPRHLTDQLLAAVAEADHHFATKITADPAGRRTTLTTQAPSWVQPFIAAHNQAVAEEHHACPHRTQTGPTVLHVAVWAPGYVACTRCAEAGLLNTLVPPGEDHRCDVCGQDAPDGLHPGLLKGGYALIHFAVCDPCNDSGAVTR